MTAVIADDYTFRMCFFTFHILQAGPPKRREARGNLPHTLPLDRTGCVNNALIDGF